MKTVRIVTVLFAVVCLMLCGTGVVKAEPMGTAFTYQGRLIDANSAADGLYDFQFKLYDSPADGNQFGSTIDINDLDVIDGSFTLELDFGPDIFTGSACWLETAVRPGDSNDVYTTLSPLVELTPTPYALYAETAGGDGDWRVSGDDMYAIPSGTVTVSRSQGAAGPGLKVSRSLAWPEIGHTRMEIDSDSIDIYRSRFPITSGATLGLNSNSSGNVILAGGGGNVGIGTIGPLAKLHVEESGSAEPFRVSVSGSTKLIVKNDGNVGIGTTNPQSKLSVGGKGTANTGVYGSGSTYGVYGSGTWGVHGKGSSVGVQGEDSDSGSYGRLGFGIFGGYFVGKGYFSGNVGIGTTSPWAGLHIKGNGWPGSFMYLQSNTGQDAGIRLYEGDTIKWHLFNDSAAGGLSLRNSDYTSVLFIEQSTGNVRVRVLEITGGSDLSEQFEVSDEGGKVKPGMVVCIDADNPGSLVVSKESYDRTVAGIVSGAGGVKPGMLMGQKGTKADGEHPVALTGRVYCWADASNNSIEPGDLLTTSDMAGHAMKVTDYTKAQGAILGKAMSSLESGKGLVLVLVSLQ